MNIDSTELENAIAKVLKEASKDPGGAPSYLTAYQILRRLPGELRNALVATYAPAGKGADSNYSAATRVGHAAGKIAEIVHLDSRDLNFDVGSEVQLVEGGSPKVRLCRAR
jgi:hypothetical protein